MASEKCQHCDQPADLEPLEFFEIGNEKTGAGRQQVRTHSRCAFPEALVRVGVLPGTFAMRPDQP